MWYVKLNDTIKTLDFLRSHSKSPISWLKSAIMKTPKIGLNKHLFKNKKSAIGAEILKMVPLASLCGGVAHRSLTASQSKDCSLSLAELRSARSPDIASQAQPSAN